jgi:hypothetical protein
MSLKLVPKVDNTIELQDGAGTPFMIIDASGNVEFPGIVSADGGPIGLGGGQTWQDVSGSRSSGVTYTNNTGKPIVVRAGSSGGNSTISLTVGGVLADENAYLPSASGTGKITVMAEVPDGEDYVVTASTAIFLWSELR